MGFEEAVAKSEKAPKKLFIDVYTDWCGWCKKMDKTTFAETEVAKYINENYTYDERIRSILKKLKDEKRSILCSKINTQKLLALC